MDTRFLETFVVIAEQQSVARAARHLNLTPAAVAQRIKALEAEVGVKLLSRSGRVLRPTEAGFKVLEQAKLVLRETRNLKALATSHMIAGELRIGAIHTALTGILPDILSNLTQQHSSIEVFIKPGVSIDLYNDVLKGDLDAALIIEPRFIIPKSHSFRKMKEEPLILIVPKALEKSDPLELLRTLPFIRYDRSQWGGNLADECLKQTRIQPIERYELDSLEAIAIMVDRGLGISIVPNWSPPWPSGINIATLSIPDNTVFRYIGILTAQISPKQNLVNALLDLC